MFSQPDVMTSKVSVQKTRFNPDDEDVQLVKVVRVRGKKGSIVKAETTSVT